MGGEWWSVAICIHKILYKQFSYFNTVCFKKYPGNKECFHSCERKQIWPSIISLLVATIRQYTKLLVL